MEYREQPTWQPQFYWEHPQTARYQHPPRLLVADTKNGRHPPLPPVPWSTYSSKFFRAKRLLVPNRPICGVSLKKTGHWHHQKLGEQTGNTYPNRPLGPQGRKGSRAGNSSRHDGRRSPPKEVTKRALCGMLFPTNLNAPDKQPPENKTKCIL